MKKGKDGVNRARVWKDVEKRKKNQKKQKTIRIASKQDYGNGEITGN